MPIAPGPIPESHLSTVKPIQKRIICHWTVTGYEGDEHCKDSYHYIVQGDGTLVRGYRYLDEPTAHTYGFNSAIGLSICCMGGWNGTYTPYPPTKEQWDTLCAAVKQLCQTYNIPIDRNHVLMHGEVTEVLGLDQWGKWDIGYLPHLGIGPETGRLCGNELRRTVLMEGTGNNVTLANPPVKIRLQGSPTVLEGFLTDATTMVPLRKFVEWAAEAGYKIKLGSVNTEHRTYYLRTSGPPYDAQSPVGVLEKGYLQLGDTGYAELRDITDWLGLKVKVETWTREKRILVVLRP